MLAPPVGSLPLPRWVRGHYRYLVDRVSSDTSFKSRQRASRAFMRYDVSLSSGPFLPAEGGLRHCHVSCGVEPRLLAEVDSGAATCPLAPDLASLSRWALVLPHVPLLQALPLQGGSSSATTCPMTPVGCGP
jgi:hypothetical protein